MTKNTDFAVYYQLILKSFILFSKQTLGKNTLYILEHFYVSFW